MQFSNPSHDTVKRPSKQSQGKPHSTGFPLDSRWATKVSDSAPPRAYPSPPMSSTPPPPPRHNPESSEHTLGSYGPGGQAVYRGPPQPPLMPQPEIAGQPGRAYPPEAASPATYTPFRLDMPAGQLFYQPQPFMVPPNYAQHPLQGSPFPTPEGPSTREGSDYNSPRNQRKAKGHVASACVPCKKAHLRCDAQRPCSRCISNGKEDTCIDVQHKKRGRPRLRDEREGRYDSLGAGYSQSSSEASMRRPVSLYGSGGAQIGTPFGDSLQRSGSYRVLKSQGPNPGHAPIAPQYIEQAMQSANVYGPIQPAPRMLASQEPICAYLSMEMQFTKTTQSFCDYVGIPTLTSRKLQDIIIQPDVEKVLRLQRSFEDERREQEPNFLPPIYLKFEEDRIIQNVGFGQDVLNQIRLDRQETITFQGANGQQRTFVVQLGLGKKDSTYFVVMMVIPPPPAQQQYPAPPPYAREGYPRDQQFGYHSQQPFIQAGPSSYPQHPPSYGGGITPYQPQTPSLGSNVPPANVQQQYAQHPRQEYQPPPAEYQPTAQQHYQPSPSQSQYPTTPHQTPYQRPTSQPQYQTPPGEMHPAQSSRARDLQLPPIRDPRGESSADPRRRDDRSGRVDIGGLIDKPDTTRRGP